MNNSIKNEKEFLIKSRKSKNIERDFSKKYMATKKESVFL